MEASVNTFVQCIHSALHLVKPQYLLLFRVHSGRSAYSTLYQQTLRPTIAPRLVPIATPSPRLSLPTSALCHAARLLVTLPLPNRDHLTIARYYADTLQKKM